MLDPMCGSGTTLVEGNLAGYRAIGFDLNPLSVMITRTKCSILRMDPKMLVDEHERLKVKVRGHASRSQGQRRSYFETLPLRDQRYLESWFAPRVLDDLDLIAANLEDLEPSPYRDLFWVCLSDVLRSVSWQKADDLRVRREERPEANIDAIAEYLTRLDRTLRNVVAFLLEEGMRHDENFAVYNNDARQCAKVLGQQRVDAVITSPPYATALPYLDTDRLSLCYLKLLERDKHRAADYEMIGNREISGGQRVSLWNTYLNRAPQLPAEVRHLVDEVDVAYRATDVGFRRKNLSTLLAKYFLDMQGVLSEINSIVNDGGHVFVVVGDNHTVAQGRRIDIQTARLIAVLGESVGMQVVELIPMEMLTPRDIFKKNSVGSEHIVHFRVRC